ncbi:ABC transporter permease [Verminephrobacter aporrectodeae subsp. tuberculatae]|uniref:ABC transporter permease n=1 Tax=Verminephrobacter aporrectodeae TaxID=1110389 RepID=UPI002238FD5B|nr:FtsX-like permease family protein [Verminephrobacter aporrectodeae]MCW5221211.1 ABC transporter permease [Verminephrobacter aporrectodeae subsp. tuberculatae]MCW5290502.1 ABC transporter permease [Verminephrobacter aporrectodeae subsp. tuberculatae]
MKWFVYAWRNVARNRRRTVLSAAIVACGSMALLLSIGFVLASFYGLRESIISSELGHIQIGAHGQFEGNEERPLQYGLSPQQVKAAEDEFQQESGLRFSTRRVLFEGLLSTGRRSVAFVGQGVEPEKESRLSTVFAPIVSGNGLSDDPSRPEQILIAVDLARSLQVKPGDTITVMVTTEDGVLNAVDAVVAGTYRTGVPDLDRRAIMMPLQNVQSLLVTQKISRLVLALRDTDATDALASRLRAQLPDLDIKRWIELAPFYNQVVSLYRIIFTVLGIIIAMVVFISTANSMLMSVMERIREVGTLRAIGIPDRRIQQTFLLEGGMIGMLGGSVGLVLALLTALVVNLSDIRMPPPPGRTTDYPLIIAMQLDSSLMIWLAFIMLSALAAWAPHRVIRRLSIIEKLNHV